MKRIRRTLVLTGLMMLLAPAIEGAAQPAAGFEDIGWLSPSLAALEVSAPPADDGEELDEVRRLALLRSTRDVERILWWNVGGPAYRWNQIAIEEMLDRFVTTLPATRNLSLLHAAIDDAVAAAWLAKGETDRQRPAQRDPSIPAVIPLPEGSSYPSDHAAAAAAAAGVLAYLFPDRAEAFAALAEEAMRSRILAGVDYPSDVAAGRAIGEQVAALAIARGETDGTDRPWTGTVPVGPGLWQGENPIAPLAGTWRPWVLSRSDEFRPPAPPAFDSETVRQALAELKDFTRTPESNHRAVYWEVFGGARGFALWNEIARVRLLEHAGTFDALASARLFTALNVAYQDAIIACFEAKYAYWYIRPSQLDAGLEPVFPPPNHPSYPAAHACLSTAAATVLARFFPAEERQLLALAEEAAEARIWAGIHYRFDIEAGAIVGRQVALKVLDWVRGARTLPE
ncbi:MAG: phosphatase PAP2 family protein [Bauldia sp.]|nr:phosphatase PAP2 family protein [Bauldia sp.]